MPAWKTFDENTADALKEHLGDAAVSTVGISGPLFDGSNSVLIAPTLQKGAAFVITARAKQKPAVDARPTPSLQIVEPLPPEPVIEGEAPVLFAPEPLPAPALEQWVEDEPVPAQESPSVESEADETADLTFGPTTWERAEVADPVSIPIEPEGHSEIRSSDPEVWDLPSEAPPQRWTDEIVAPPSEDDRHVATGFLGLDDYVEDEEEIARAKRPWWKKIFTD
ncbi:MAG: hypothetical protein ACM3JB_20205 [Acidobacteriaceae bacterium]